MKSITNNQTIQYKRKTHNTQSYTTYSVIQLVMIPTMVNMFNLQILF